MRISDWSSDVCSSDLRRQHVEPLLLLAQLARVRMMHVEAIGAAVDLRRADLDQLEQIGLDPGLFDLLREREPGLHQLRRGLVGVGTGGSRPSPVGGCHGHDAGAPPNVPWYWLA